MKGEVRARRACCPVCGDGLDIRRKSVGSGRLWCDHCDIEVDSTDAFLIAIFGSLDAAA